MIGGTEQVQDIHSFAKSQGEGGAKWTTAQVHEISTWGASPWINVRCRDASEVLERGVGRGNKAWHLADHQAWS
jgi:hypothetical protein